MENNKIDVNNLLNDYKNWLKAKIDFQEQYNIICEKTTYLVGQRFIDKDINQKFEIVKFHITDNRFSLEGFLEVKKINDDGTINFLQQYNIFWCNKIYSFPYFYKKLLDEKIEFI